MALLNAPNPPLGKVQGIDPLAPIEHLAQSLAGVVAQLALGLLLGYLAARALRQAHMHWSWAVVGFGVILVSHAALAGYAPALAMAALSAAARGRRWHREDLEAGVDLAELARARQHPLDALRGGARSVCSRLARTRLAGSLAESYTSRLRGAELVLGEDRHRRAVRIELGGARGGAHTLVVGATGAGKTVTQAWIATQAVARGMAAVVVDPKGDHALRAAMRGAALAADRRFVEWTPSGPSSYNPYARGGETEIADKALAAERYTEPHYQRQAQRYLGHAVRALHSAGREVSLRELVGLLDPVRLESLARELPPERAQGIHDYLDSLTARQRTELSGVRDRLAIAVESDVGPWLDPATPGAQRFDLREAIDERAVIYFDLRADSRPLLAQMLGGAIVQDLQSTIAARQQTQPVPTLVLIDEFSALAAEHVARLFARARSAGVSLVLGTQELSDLRLPGRELLLEQVLGNLTTVIAHRQVVPDSAELIARLAGTRGAWSTSWSRDGRGTRTRTRTHLIAPTEVRSLARGHAAVIPLTGQGRVALTRVLAPGTRI